MLRVFHRERAGRPLRIIWVLEEVGEPYELTVMTREEGSGEDHLARHPLGRVPVLQDEEGFVFESAALCLHLGDLHPGAGLVPPLGTHDRALVYQWACFAPAELEPPLFELWIQAKRDPPRAEEARKRFFAATDAVEGALDGAEFLVAEKFTVADVMVGSALLFTTRAGIADQLSPSLTGYLGRLGQRPAFQRALQRTFG
ncbi:MAG: glutathione S-transferase family protein [Solirubrobacteraceae bacterium]